MLRNFTLQPLFYDVQNLLTSFSHISLSHIYRDRNRIADGLSKDGLGLNQGAWIISEQRDGHIFDTHDSWVQS
jgi:hypothetical protein